jgi:hypothetical protein
VCVVGAPLYDPSKRRKRGKRRAWEIFWTTSGICFDYCSYLDENTDYDTETSFAHCFDAMPISGSFHRGEMV